MKSVGNFGLSLLKSVLVNGSFSRENWKRLPAALLWPDRPRAALPAAARRVGQA